MTTFPGTLPVWVSEGRPARMPPFQPTGLNGLLTDVRKGGLAWQSHGPLLEVARANKDESWRFSPQEIPGDMWPGY